MNSMILLENSDLIAIEGGADSLARDLGQYVGGFYGALIQHPILTHLPYVGSFISNGYALYAAMQ